MKQIIINFLTSRTNLTIFQCMLYLMLGYMIGEYLTWQKMSIIFVVLFLIQFITRTKAVADGMMFRQIMIDSQVDANDIVKKMKDVYDIDKNGVDKDEWN
jgi:hypothetical protein